MTAMRLGRFKKLLCISRYKFLAAIKHLLHKLQFCFIFSIIKKTIPPIIETCLSFPPVYLT
jgi:hypothetical protein